MVPAIATFVTAVASATLIRLDRDEARISKAIWIPFVWLSIACSRPVSNWMSFSAPVNVSNSYIDGSPIDRNVMTFLLALAVLVLCRRSRQVGLILRANVSIVLFFLYCGVSILWADFPFVVLKRWIRSVGDVAMVCIILTEAHPVDAFKMVLTWMGSLLVPLSILFTRFFPSLGRSYTYGGAPMWTGVATDKNALGALCMLVGVVLLTRGLALYFSNEGRRRQRRLMIIGALLSMVIYLLLMIDSKTALACFSMASILVVLVNRVSALRTPWFITSVVAAMVTVCYSVLFLGIGSSALREMGRDTSLTGRTEVWEIVLPFAVNPWIGAGYESFWIGERLDTIVRAIGAFLNQAHNGYIEVYLNIGWIGLLLLGSVSVSGYRNIIRGLRESPETTGLKLSLFLICLVYNFTEAAFKFLSPVWITFLWATMTLPRSRSSAPLVKSVRWSGAAKAANDALWEKTPHVYSRR